MSVEKRDGVWINSEIPGATFGSREAARQAKKINDQENAMATYDENLRATEALDGAEDTAGADLVAEVAEEFPTVESFEQHEEDGTEVPDVFDGFTREVSELADGSVERETVKQVRERENVVYMALYGNTEPAKAYWRKLAEARGYEVPEDATV